MSSTLQEKMSDHEKNITNKECIGGVEHQKLSDTVFFFSCPY